MTGRPITPWLLGVLLLIGGLFMAAPQVSAAQFGGSTGPGRIICWIGNRPVNQCPQPQPPCEEVLGLAITSVSNGNRLESQTFTGSELTPRHPIAAGARYNSGNGRWEDPNNASNYVTFQPEIRLSRKTCSGHDPQFTGQEISHNTMPVDAGHSVDILITQTCENCAKRRLTASIPVDTVAASQPVTQPPPTVNPPIIPPIIRPAPIALTATPQCSSGQPLVSLAWTGGAGATAIVVWRDSARAGGHGGWERLQTYSGKEAELTAFTDRAVTAGQQYQYSIEAQAGSGTQRYSPNIPASVPTCEQPPVFTLAVTTACTKANRPSATLTWKAVPGATSYSIITHDQRVDPGFSLPVTTGPDRTTITLAMQGDSRWQIYAFTPAGVSKSNEVSLGAPPCGDTTPAPTPPAPTPTPPPATPPPSALLPATIAATGTARFTVTGLPEGGTWDRLEFPGLTLNGGRAMVSIEGGRRDTTTDHQLIPVFELSEAKPAIDLYQRPELVGQTSFTLTIRLATDANAQQTPRIPKILVSARPPKPTPAPTLQFSAGVEQDRVRLGLTNWGPGGVELANAAPFVITTLAGETVYAPGAAAQVTGVSAGQTKSWTWDYAKSDGTAVPSGTYLVTLTYRFSGENRTAGTQFVKSSTEQSQPSPTEPTGAGTTEAPRDPAPVVSSPASGSASTPTPTPVTTDSSPGPTTSVPTVITQGLEAPTTDTTAASSPVETPASTPLPASASPAPAPAQPAGLKGSAPSRTSIALTWQDKADDESEYIVERRLTTCKIRRVRVVHWRFRIERTCPEFSAVTTLDANITSYTDTKLRRNTLYEYRVSAQGEDNASAPSSAVRVRTRR